MCPDAYFKAQGAGYRDAAPIADEPGREIVMTFRSLDGGGPARPFMDNISDIFDVESGARHQPVPKATRDLFLKIPER